MATIPAFSAPDWLKTETAEQIQARMMESLPPDIDDTEGGFPWDFTYPTALEKDELLNFHLGNLKVDVSGVVLWGLP